METMLSRVPGLAALLCVVLFPPFAARAGSIHGQVQLAPVTPAPSRVRDPYAGRAAALPDPRVPARGLPQDAVVYIASLPDSVNQGLPFPSTGRQLAQQQQSFQPRVIALPAGGSVDFPNLDPIFHSVFSVSPTKRFDLGRYGRGRSKRVRFDKPGLVNVYCDIHSNMEGFVLVTPNRAVARPDETGRYALPDLPPGRYVVKAWHPDMAPIERDVVVPASGDVEVDLRLSP
jgi:plastocyanin